MAEPETTTTLTTGAMSRTATTAESFHLFFEFPREIQDLIWEFACQQAVETFLKGPLFSIKDWWQNTNYTWIAYHPQFGWNPYVLDVYRLPKFAPILHTCRFSRVVALTWWKCVTKDAVVLSPDTGDIHQHLMVELKENIADVRARIDREQRIQTRL